jgi:short-subunit dehydrogenase
MISVTALMPDGFTAVSPATKAFVLAFTEALVVEQGPKGVQVQAVLPGITRTPIWIEEPDGRPAARDGDGSRRHGRRRAEGPR